MNIKKDTVVQPKEKIQMSYVLDKDFNWSRQEGTVHVYYSTETCKETPIGKYTQKVDPFTNTTYEAFDLEGDRLLLPMRELKPIEQYFKRKAVQIVRKQKKEKQLSTHKKTNTMNTQTEKPKNDKPVSRLYIVEQGTWKNGQEVLTFYYRNDEGKPKAIAHSFVHYEKDGQTFRTQDAKGNEIFPPCANRYDLKKYALDNEQDLIQKFEKSQGQEKTPLQQNAQTAKQPEQVKQPVNNPEQPKQSARQKNNSRKNELGEIRNEKDANEKDQTISR